jgi:hypothetical protein
MSSVQPVYFKSINLRCKWNEMTQKEICLARSTDFMMKTINDQ